MQFKNCRQKLKNSDKKEVGRKQYKTNLNQGTTKANRKIKCETDGILSYSNTSQEGTN